MNVTEQLTALAAPFTFDELLWRPGPVSKKQEPWTTKPLAYIDARVAMDRLDAIIGPMNWSNRYAVGSQGGQICEIGIRDESGEFIFKADGAQNTDIEPFKGGCSDAFKRACARWGMGRYLYGMDSPWVPVETYEFKGQTKVRKITKNGMIDLRKAYDRFLAGKNPTPDLKPGDQDIRQEHKASQQAQQSDQEAGAIIALTTHIDSIDAVLELHEWPDGDRRELFESLSELGQRKVRAHWKERDTKLKTGTV